jgi:hypothetical protein
MVVIFSVATYQLAFWMKGKQLLLNQVDLVDVDLTTGQVRGQTWFNVFSPNSTTYNVSVTPRLPGSEGVAATADEVGAAPAPAPAPPAADGMRTVVSWLGLPGEALGGMERSGSPGLFQGSYEFAPQSDTDRENPRPMTMQNVPIQVWSSKSFTARWTKPADSQPPAIAFNLRRRGDRIQGTLRNPMDVALKDCLLVFRAQGGSGRRPQVVAIPELKAGQTHSIGLMESPSDLAEHLKGIHYVSGDDKSTMLTRRAREYSSTGTDVPAILKWMSFYDVVGGHDYTRLLHRYQGHVDLSHLFHEKLPDNRAILIGFSSQQAAQVHFGDRDVEGHANDRHWTCYRFVTQVVDN